MVCTGMCYKGISFIDQSIMAAAGADLQQREQQKELQAEIDVSKVVMHVGH